MNYNEALTLTTQLTALNLIISSIEFIGLKKYFANNHSYLYLLFFILRLIGAILILIAPNLLVLIFLFLTMAIIHYHLKGTFNGGSDHVTTLTLFILIVLKLFSNNVLIIKGTLLYFTFQIILSYFIPGILKLKNKDWRNGSALKNIINGNCFSPNYFIKKILKKQSVLFITSLIIIVLELVFPLILISKHPLLFCLIAFLFHLMNFFILGLNRFVFAWAATYPIVIFTTTYLIK